MFPSEFGGMVLAELGPEDVSLLERCPHFRGWYMYVQASMELGSKERHPFQNFFWPFLFSFTPSLISSLPSLSRFLQVISLVPTDPHILQRVGEMYDQEGDRGQAYQYHYEVCSLQWNLSYLGQKYQ